MFGYGSDAATVRRGAAESAAYLEEWRQALSPVTQSSIGAGSLEALQTDYASTLLRVSNPKLAPNAFGRHVREGAGGERCARAGL